MSIICGTDLSPRSVAALEVARALAAQRGEREVVLVHAVEDEDKAAGARAALDAFVASAPGTTPVRAELAVGVPEESLLTFADTEGADLIVIAPSASPTSMFRLGSTAERLIATSGVPVLVVRDPKPWLAFASGERPLRLLVGVDESVSCDLGIQWTHALRQRGPVEVVLGRIYYPDDAADYYGVAHGAVVDRDPVVEQLITRDLLRKFGDNDRVTARALRGLGRLGDHMLELAKDAGVDAIVVGTHQKTGLGRLGSVSAVVVHDATQSVICVPPNAAIPTLQVPRLVSALVATDLSSFANRAVPFAFALTDEGGEVHIAHVVDEDHEIDEVETKRQLLALAPTGMKRQVSAHILRGSDAAKTIAQAAAREGVDAICIASHGRSGITRALVGSVADKLLRETRKPVLVLRPA
ncbi:MAG: universal stress protein [Kofleriaceae bacterium]|nr:universal stress protein [Kofleriaceae bacterium]